MTTSGGRCVRVCDVMSEKPMTIDAEKCQAILDAAARHRTARLTVTFNYRYAPHHGKIKELVHRRRYRARCSPSTSNGCLIRAHGADYFRRWHRDKRNSGGLMVHKATHHFDLDLLWLSAAPESVFGLRAARLLWPCECRGARADPLLSPVSWQPVAQGDPWAMHCRTIRRCAPSYLDAEHEDGYIRDQKCVRRQHQHRGRHGPARALRQRRDDVVPLDRVLSLGGPRHHVQRRARPSGSGDPEASYVSGVRPGTRTELQSAPRLTLWPQWSEARDIPAETGAGDHGGGDERLLADNIFGLPVHDPLGRAAGMRDGALSILTGIAANRAFASGLPVRIADLVWISGQGCTATPRGLPCHFTLFRAPQRSTQEGELRMRH